MHTKYHRAMPSGSRQEVFFFNLKIYLNLIWPSYTTGQNLFEKKTTKEGHKRLREGMVTP